MYLRIDLVNLKVHYVHLRIHLVDGAVAVAVLVALVQAGPISAAKLTDLYCESRKSTYG